MHRGNCRRAPIGVDVEVLSRKVDRSRVAARYFHPNEYEYLKDLSSDQVEAEFLNLWCLKEAYVKATGEGVLMGFHRFSILLESHSIWVKKIQIDPDYITTIAVLTTEQPEIIINH